jgi:acyl-CoA hydrolase
MKEFKYSWQTRSLKSSHVLPPDTNCHGTLYGGKLMAHIDDVAALSAMKHSQCRAVTASTDSIDFLHPIKVDQKVSLEAFVTWTHKTSMEVFVKVIADDLLTEERKICATSFLTFVAVDQDGRPTHVPAVIPQTEEEIYLYEQAPVRAEVRRLRRIESKKLAEKLGTKYPWEIHAEATLVK